jgi:hypothetical protein
MSNQNLLSNESISELYKLISLLDEDSSNIDVPQAISDYLVPILTSLLGEVEANRQFILQTADRASLALLMTEKTFLGDVLTGVADHFSALVEELPAELVASNERVAASLAGIQDLLATWMSFSADDEDEGYEDDDDDEDEGDDDEGVDDNEGGAESEETV